MAIEGPLKELGIHDVFQLLDLSRKTGVLTVSSRLRHNQGRVYFDDGKVVAAEVQSNPHPLGELLVRAGKVTEADLRRARDMQEQGDGRRLGEILVVIDAISERELERQVRFQIEEVVFELMSWREGYFSFEEGPLERIPAEAAIRIATESVLMEGARRIDEWSRIEGKIPHLGVVPMLAPGGDGESGGLDLLPAEWEVLAAIDGHASVREIARQLARSEFDVAKIIFGLEAAGIVCIGDPGRAPAPAAAPAEHDEDVVSRASAALEVGDVDAARGWADTAQSQQPHDPEVYLVLGQVDLAEGHAREAEEHLRRALRLDPLLGPAHRLLGNALARQGRHAEAVEWWERWLKIEDGTEEAEQVQQAVAAARTLAALLEASHGG